jgi:hypothetical protein
VIHGPLRPLLEPLDSHANLAGSSGHYIEIFYNRQRLQSALSYSDWHEVRSEYSNRLLPA